MIVEIHGRNVAECYREGLHKLAVFGIKEPSRGGPVRTIQSPVMLTMANPRQRVLMDPLRNANPMFHVMEVVWMLAGEQHVSFLTPFNKRMVEFANDGILHGAYGHRWMYPVNQIRQVVNKLLVARGTRQAVISMWDPRRDNAWGMNDYPCNTHIYFRVVDGKLNMTVCNRSNDFVWGMLGANIVHMTYLHELVAFMSKLPLGVYQVFTNNLHMYERHEPLLESRYYVDIQYLWEPYPLLHEGENYEDLMTDCIDLVLGREETEWRTKWMRNVADPMHSAWLLRGIKEKYIERIQDPAWKQATIDWFSRKSESSDALGKSTGTTQSES